jgi:hypothetical protein
MTSHNLSQTLISLLEGDISSLNEKIVFWFSVLEERLYRKMLDEKYSAVKSIFD